MWCWRYERIFKVRQRFVFCIISFQNIGRQRWYRGRIHGIIIRTGRHRRGARHCCKTVTTNVRIRFIAFRTSPPPLRRSGGATAAAKLGRSCHVILQYIVVRPGQSHHIILPSNAVMARKRSSLATSH